MSKRLLSTQAPSPGRSRLRATLSFLRHAALRSLRLCIILQPKQWKSLKESGKIVFHKDRRLAGLRAIVHAVPFVTVLSLMVLNLRRVYIGEATTTTLAAFQFAAKVIELTILASLVGIILEFVRYNALGSDPFPLGAFLAPYQMTNISYLWSSELWGSLTSNHLHKRHRILLAIIVPPIAILIPMIGPSNAVLMIPRMINYPTCRFLVLLNEINLQSVELSGGHVTNEATIEKALLQLLGRFLLPTGDGPKGMELGHKFYITDSLGTRVLEYWLSYDDHSINIISTVPTRSAALALTGPKLQNNGTISRQSLSVQPYVQQNCVSGALERNQSLQTAFVSFGAGKSDLNNIIPLTYVVPNAAVSELNSSLVFSTLTESTQTAMLSWFEPPNASRDYSLLTILTTSDEAMWTYMACTIGAKWVKALSSVNITFNSMVIESAPEKREWLEDASGTVSIRPSWAKRVAELYVNSTGHSARGEGSSAVFGTFVAANAIQAVGLSDSVSIPVSDPWTVFGQTRTTSRQDSNLNGEQYDAMLRYLEKAGYRHQYKDIHVATRGNWTDPARLKQIQVQEYLNGYGYDSSTLPVQLSMVVLGTYGLIAFAFIVYMIVTGRSGSSWDSVSEIVMLALNSRRPEHLSGTSVGVETLSTFREPVNVRVGKDGSAEMVFQNDPSLTGSDYTEIKPNVRY